MIGWIKLHRSLLDHWTYKKSKEPFTMREAWIDILLNVNFEDKKVLIGNEFFICKAGESMYSQLTWAKRWRWSKSRVQRFFILLQKDDMIRTKSVRKSTHLTVCNWVSYQQQRINSESIVNQSRINVESMLGTTKEGKEREEVKEEKNNNVDKGKADKFKVELLKDQMFIESTCMALKISKAIFEEHLKEFALYKKSLGEDTWRTYNDFRKNFRLYLPKKINNKTHKPTTLNGKEIPIIVSAPKKGFNYR